MILKYILPLILLNISSDKNIYYEEHREWGRFFNEKSISGCFLLYDLNSDKYMVYNPGRIDSGYIPASTFKIFNSLAALESGALKNENEIIAWDGIQRDIESWNKDHNLRTAFRNSVVWYYQEIARRIGYEKMQHYIDLAEYGNRNIQGGIDLFWLEGDLRITPKQQVDFLVKLFKDSLPFSKRSMDIVKDIMILKEDENFILRAKTGWGIRFDKQIGWFVGYVETLPGKDVYFFANNIDINDVKDAEARYSITEGILREMKIVK